MRCPDCINTNGMYIPLFGMSEPCQTCDGTQSLAIDNSLNSLIYNVHDIEEVKMGDIIMNRDIIINGTAYDIASVSQYGQGFKVDTQCGKTWILFECLASAGEDAMSYYENRLSPTNEVVQEWIEQWLDIPEIHFAIDRKECQVEMISLECQTLFGCIPEIAYRQA